MHMPKQAVVLQAVEELVQQMRGATTAITCEGKPQRQRSRLQ